MAISTGQRVNQISQPLAPSDLSSYYVLFDANSDSLISHTINVFQFPIVITAYNLVFPEIVEVYRVTLVNGVEYSTPVFIQGQQVFLTSTNNVLVLNISGLYNFKLSAGLGSVIVVAQDANLVNSNGSNAVIGG